MKTKDVIDLLALAFLWGLSFIFMRVAAPQFGPVALIEVRVAIAAVLLLILLYWKGKQGSMWQHVKPIGVVGVLNSALPFCLLAFATLSVSAGFAAVLNATTPLWGALIAWVWLRDKLTPLRIAGLLIGFAGVCVLVWGKITFKPGATGFAVTLAIGAALLATLSYGVAASTTKKYLTGVDSLANATGSQLSAAVVLLPFAMMLWPATMPDAKAWGAAIALAVLCTALAYILYFRLIANVGAAKAITVTFLVPAFAMVWGYVLLHEPVTPQMLLGAVVILIGTGLSTGLIKLPQRQQV